MFVFNCREVDEQVKILGLERIPKMFLLIINKIFSLILCLNSTPSGMGVDVCCRILYTNRI